MSDLKPGEYMGGTHAGQRFQWWIDGLGAIQHGMVLGAGLTSNCAADKADIRSAIEALTALADETEVEYVELPDRMRLKVQCDTGYALAVEYKDAFNGWGPSVAEHIYLAVYRAGLERRP